eukprot:TRINITY_DN873_c0_g1_i1.p1 TRINITY_DN873_c0_g1~~TRINITY_DN873_c0_g1_i1.p1  ORF type:complete len:618 (+),score=164.62 TRINITY_DN873_c0_g1_i1:45-1898(+)
MRGAADGAWWVAAALWTLPGASGDGGGASAYCRGTPPPASLPFNDLKYLISTQRSCLLNHIEIQAAPIHWKQPGAAAGSVEERIETAYALSLDTGGVMQIADALLQNFADGGGFSDALVAFDLNATRLRGNDGWRYGEQRNRSTLKPFGYFYQTITDRPAWPDPVCAVKNGFWNCAMHAINDTGFYNTRWRPRLQSTVWAGIIGPLHLDWTQHMLSTDGAPTHLPEETNAFRLTGPLMDMLDVNIATIGGFYEYPVPDGELKEAPLTIDVASNLVLYRALMMALTAFDETTSPPLHARMRNAVQHIQNLLLHPKFPVWDAADLMFVSQITIPKPFSHPATYVVGEGDVDTQFIAIATLGNELNTLPYPLFDGAKADAQDTLHAGGCPMTVCESLVGEDGETASAYRAHNLYTKLRGTYGVVDEGLQLRGFSRTPGGEPDIDLTMLGIVAASELYRIYRNSSGCIYSRYPHDMKHMRDEMLSVAGCDLQPNVTGTECSRSRFGAARYAYLNSDGLPSLHTTAWGVIAEAVMNTSRPFSPFALPEDMPFPQPSGGADIPTFWMMLAAMLGFGALLVLLAAATKMRTQMTDSRFRSVLHVDGVPDGHFRTGTAHRSYGTQ